MYATLHIVINIKLRASVEILYTDVTIENVKIFLVLTKYISFKNWTS